MSHRKRARSAGASAWPRRLALATLLAALPLVFFGGGVTTLHAGLAIDGWLVLEPGRGDHFLWLYPLDKWFRDVGTFVEHTHRLFGSLVGLLSIATVVATWKLDRRSLPRVLSLAGLFAVILQGTLGGLRVLEKSDGLAFLHGAIGQAVFALLGATCVVLSPGFSGARPAPVEAKTGRRLRGLAAAAIGAVYLQIVAGAWLRHGGDSRALALHGLLAVAVVFSVVLLAAELSQRARLLEGEVRLRLLWLRRALIACLAYQLVLGVASLLVVALSVDPASGGVGLAVIPTLHVLGGAGLLLACVACAMWTQRLFTTRSSEIPQASSHWDSHPNLEAARPPTPEFARRPRAEVARCQQPEIAR